MNEYMVFYNMPSYKRRYMRVEANNIGMAVDVAKAMIAVMAEGNSDVKTAADAEITGIMEI